MGETKKAATKKATTKKKEPKKPEVNSNIENWVTMKDIQAYLGVGRDTILQWIDKREMPAYKVGRLWKLMCCFVSVRHWTVMWKTLWSECQMICRKDPLVSLLKNESILVLFIMPNYTPPVYLL